MVPSTEIEKIAERPMPAEKLFGQSRSTPALISYTTLIVLVLFSFLASSMMKKWTYREVNMRLHQELEERRLVIYSQMERYINYLQSTQAFFAASKHVDRDEWKVFVEKYGLFEKYPGIVATAYIERITPETKEIFQSEVRNDTSILKEGYPDFKIFPEGDRSEYFVIKYIEPDSERKMIMGFDIGSEATRRSALERARDLGAPVATGRFKLLQDKEDKPAIGLIIPIYKNGASVANLNERLEGLVGFVNIVLRTQLIFEKMKPADFHNNIRYRIYDGEYLTRYLSNDHLLFDSAPDSPEYSDNNDDQFTSFISLTVAERVWTIRADGGAGFMIEASNELLPFYTLLTGMVFSALIFAIVYLLTTARFRAQEEAKKMLEKLQQSESIFHTMTDHSPLGIILTDREGQTQYVNSVAQQLSGLDSDACLGLGWLNAIHPHDSERIRIEWLQVVKSPHLVRTDFRFLRKDGTTVWVHANIAPILQAGHVFGYAATIEDVSERMLMELALRESEQYNRSLFDQSPIGLLLCDRAGSIIDVNAAFAKIVGRSVKECLSVTYWKTVPKEKMDYEKKVFESLRSSDTRGPYETELVRKDGSLTAVRIWSLVVQKAEISFIMSSVEDINDRKLVEEGLRRAQDDLIESEKTSMVAKLAAGAAHEVKNPLAIILQGIDYLSGCVSGKEKEAAQVLLDMSTAVKRADGIVKGLLDVAVFTELLLKQENINETIEDSIRLVKSIADHKHISIVKKLKSNLSKFQIDRNKIIHVLLNVFTNAFDSMKEGGTLTIETREVLTEEAFPHATPDIMEKKRKVVLINVEDTGRGIPPDILDHVFEPFFTTKRGQGGTGLGLSLVRSIVQMHNGIIEIENRKDQSGARVKIMFPIR